MPSLWCLDGELAVCCARGVARVSLPVATVRALLDASAATRSARCELAATTPLRLLESLFPRLCPECGKNHATHLALLRRLYRKHRTEPTELDRKGLLAMALGPRPRKAVGRFVLRKAG